MSSVAAGFVQALTKRASCKKGNVLVPCDQFPCLNMHSVALVLLYNMSLERSFSIERFPSYTPLKFGPKISFLCMKMNTVLTCHTV